MWIGNNKLKFNPDNMEFIVIGDDKIRSSTKSAFPVSFLGNIMEVVESVKSLGVILDADIIQCKDRWLIYVAHVTTISGSYEGSAGI